MRGVIILLGVVCYCWSLSDQNRHAEWEQFKSTHNKTYIDEKEEKLRFNIYIENKQKIEEHNQLYEKGNVSFHMAINQFGDMLASEVAKRMNGFKGAHSSRVKTQKFVSQFAGNGSEKDPSMVDWRQKGAVTPVKNQEQCGSCWAFSATGALEGQHFRSTGKLVSLSEQNLVDCSESYGNHGCNGGLMDQAYKYVKENNGIDTEEGYPYEGFNGECNFNPSDIGATVIGFEDLPCGDEDNLKNVVANIGPVSVAIDASHSSFHFYSGGIYYEPDCSSEELDHGVLVVGYGTDDNGQDYWLVKNSWATTWGYQGYIKMARNKDNNCGIATSASYPVVSSGTISTKIKYLEFGLGWVLILIGLDVLTL